ncbi:hypothetical protein JHK82_018936 [Glycine max]|nr:hypothetical protein JHK85_019374 [Glycine max]KAG5038114.1 hypothetical protein JHK86_018954 [Glycine max]KAG5143241.1 hypothetical protein JHK82_018936 [Glycine max]
MSTTNNSQSRPNKYGDGSNDESSSSSSSFSNNQDDQEHPVALGGFINFLKAHTGHFYLPPYADDSIAMNTFVFPFGFMIITLLDVATILGLPIVSDEIPSLFDQNFEDLRCSFNRSTNG